MSSNTNIPPELKDQLRKYQVDTTCFAKYYSLLHEHCPDVALVATAALLVLLRDQHHGLTIVLDIMRHSYDDGSSNSMEWTIADALALIPQCPALATELGLHSAKELSTTIVTPLAQHLRTAVATFTTFLHQHYCPSRLPRKYLIVTWQLVVLLRRDPTAFGLSPEDDPLATAMVYIKHHVSRSTEKVTIVDKINHNLGPGKGLSIPNVYMATANPPEILDWACLAVDDTLFYVETMCDDSTSIEEEEGDQQPLSKKARRTNNTIVPVLYGDAMELHEWVVRLASAAPVRPKGFLADVLPSLLLPLVGNKPVTIQPDGKIVVTTEETTDNPKPSTTDNNTASSLLQRRSSALSDSTVLHMIVTVLHELIEGKTPLAPPVQDRMRAYTAVATFVVHTATGTTQSNPTGTTTAATLLERIWTATDCKSPRAFLAIPALPRWPRIVRLALAAAHDAILDSHVWKKSTGDFYAHVVATTTTTTGRRKKDQGGTDNAGASSWPPPVLQDANDAAAGSVLADDDKSNSNTSSITWPEPCPNAIAIQLLARIEPRVRDLLHALQIVDVAITPIMGLVRYTLRHHIEFMVRRMYIVCW